MDPEKLGMMMHLARKIKTKKLIKTLHLDTLIDLRDAARKNNTTEINHSIIRDLPNNSRKDFDKRYQEVFNKEFDEKSTESKHVK